MQKIPKDAPKYRGTILVDANILIDLSVPFPEEYRENGLAPATYLDLLTFLGENDYKIIIPEMVSLESGQVPHTGQNIAKFFDFSNKKDRFVTENKILPKFLQAVANREIKNIELVRNTGPDFVNDYCNRIQIALNKYNNAYNDFLGTAKRLDKKASKAIAERTAQKALTEEFKKIHLNGKNDYGDNAILSLLKKNNEYEENNPTFVMTDDVKFIKKIGVKCHNIKVITSRQLIYNLAENNLYKKLGIVDANGKGVVTTAMDLENFRRNKLADKKIGYTHKIITIDNDIHYKNKLPYDDNYIFFSSLKDLFLDLNEQKQKKQNELSLEKPTVSTAMIEKFEKRFGRRSNGNKSVSTR